jgi:hypothetical protein
MCNNSTPGPNGLTGGLSGYLVTAGFDEATGLGSINVANLLSNWSSTTVATTTNLTSLSPVSVNEGSSGPVVITATVTSSGGTPTGNVNFFNGSALIGTATLSNGAATFNYNPSALAGGTYSITASYPWNSTFGNSTSTQQTLSVQGFKIAASPTTVTVSAPGQSGSATLTMTPLGGFNQAVSYSCTGLPSEATCTFTAVSATSETLTIATTGPSASLDRIHSGRSRSLFYALLLPGFLGLVLAAGNRKSRRVLRGLGIVALLSFVALSMPACGGGGGSSQGNPGTPVGSSTVTITATAGSLTAPPTIITLSVQ